MQSNNNLFSNYRTQRSNTCSEIWSEQKVSTVQKNFGKEINKGYKVIFVGIMIRING